MNFFGKTTRADVGVACFFVYASSLIIEIISGNTREGSPAVLGIVLLVAAAVMAAAHFGWRGLLRTRLGVEKTVSVPLSEALGAVGVVALSLSPLLPGGPLFLGLGIALIALAAGSMSVLWLSTVKVSALRERSFAIPSVVYLSAGLCLGYVTLLALSAPVGSYFLLSLPMVAIAAMSAGKQEDDGSGGRAPLALLAIVAACCAVASGVILQALSGAEGSGTVTLLRNLAECVSALLIAGVCNIFYRLAQSRANLGRSTAFASLLLIGPFILFGAYEGFAVIDHSSEMILRELDLWVLVIVIFAYEVKPSLYVMDGVAMGVMFEALCFAQMLSCAVCLLDCSAVAIAASALVLFAYCVGVYGQMKHESAPRRASQPSLSAEREQELEARADETRGPEETDAVSRFAARNNLTAREQEVFALVLKGWNAKTIAERLCISYNTSRTHVKHIYEKLDIHSHQELLVLAEELENAV